MEESLSPAAARSQKYPDISPGIAESDFKNNFRYPGLLVIRICERLRIAIHVIFLAPFAYTSTFPSLSSDFLMVQIQTPPSHAPFIGFQREFRLQNLGSGRLSLMITMDKQSGKSISPISNHSFSRFSRKLEKWIYDVLHLGSSIS